MRSLLSSLHSRLRSTSRSPDAPVEFHVEKWGRGRPVRMSTAGGRDAVAACVATHGWTAFEQPLPTVLAAVAARSKGAFYDVGANTGFYSLLARHVNRAIPIRAFEPYRPVLALLGENVALNAGAVDVVAVAVAAERGQAELFVPRADHGLVETSASLDPSFKNGEHGEVVVVPVTTLDRVNAEHAHERVGLVKIDVEGMEHAVLSGAVELIARHQPWLVVEVLPTSDLASLEEHRAGLDYLDVQLHPEGAHIAGRVTFAPTAWNHLWVPSDDVDALTATLRVCHLWPSHLAA
jgi:FkbM family methyltransferase